LPQGGTIGSDDVAPFIVQNNQVFIDDAVIADASIDNAKIADASISTAKIEDLAVESAKIKDGSISTVKIQDAAIETAKIGNAAVKTLKIAENSVTVPLYVSSGGSSASGSLFVPEDALFEVVFGGDIAQGATGAASNREVNLFVDGVFRGRCGAPYSSNGFTSICRSFGVNLISGKHSISVSGSSFASNVFASAQAVMR